MIVIGRIINVLEYKDWKGLALRLQHKGYDDYDMILIGQDLGEKVPFWKCYLSSFGLYKMTPENYVAHCMITLFVIKPHNYKKDQLVQIETKITSILQSCNSVKEKK